MGVVTGGQSGGSGSVTPAIWAVIGIAVVVLVVLVVLVAIYFRRRQSSYDMTRALSQSGMMGPAAAAKSGGSMRRSKRASSSRPTTEQVFGASGPAELTVASDMDVHDVNFDNPLFDADFDDTQSAGLSSQGAGYRQVDMSQFSMDDVFVYGKDNGESAF